MAYQPHAYGRPQVIQGRFPGGWPTIIQPKPSRCQRAAHVQEAIHQGAPQFYRRVAQREAIQQARLQDGAAQLHRTGNATLLPVTFHFAPSIGQPLPPPVQRKMETFFGADFSDVRMHVGPQAQQIGAEAFTLGSDIYFAPGQYLPEHSHGLRLLGHELAHVVQQRAGRVRNPFGGGVAVVQEPGLEAEADRLAMQAAQPSQQRSHPAPHSHSLVPHVQTTATHVVQDPTAQAMLQGGAFSTPIVQRMELNLAAVNIEFINSATMEAQIAAFDEADLAEFRRLKRTIRFDMEHGHLHPLQGSGEQTLLGGAYALDFNPGGEGRGNWRLLFDKVSDTQIRLLGILDYHGGGRYVPLYKLDRNIDLRYEER